VIAQLTNLGVPFLIRAGILAVMFVVAALLMHDIGFTPERGENPVQATRTVFRASVKYGLGNPPVRWLMLASPFTAGVGIYVFYALQPYLLELWGDEEAYTVAGLAAALLSGASILGGALAPWVRKLFRHRTSCCSASGSSATSGSPSRSSRYGASHLRSTTRCTGPTSTT
jgi:hypothetical protein